MIVNKVFSVSALPARYGDSLWITYGQDDDLHYILIDGGTAGTVSSVRECINNIKNDVKHIELLVITHIDQDHIAGILKLLSENELGFTIGDLWFNGWDHLSTSESLEEFGAKQAEILSGFIVKHKLKWNAAFEGKAVAIENDEDHPEKYLPLGMKLTLLSPLRKHLTELRPVWEKELAIAGLLPGYGVNLADEPKEDGIEAFGESMPDIEVLVREPEDEDDGEANASSIAFIAEFGGKSVLFAGDALPGSLLARLELISPGDPYPIDLLKVSHHGSAGNTTSALIKKIACSKFLISTSGASYYHPSQSTIARIIKFGTPVTNIFFNYRTPFNQVWDNEILKELYSYKTDYSHDGEILKIELIDSGFYSCTQPS